MRVYAVRSAILKVQCNVFIGIQLEGMVKNGKTIYLINKSIVLLSQILMCIYASRG